VNLSWQHLVFFLIAVCLLVTIHEFGHFWVARKCGVKVLRFSVGFGRPLWKKVSGPDQTEYVIAAIPLGGYVKMLDEREAPVPAAELHRAYSRHPHWQRIAILLAGPAANFIFAILLLTGMYWYSGSTEVRPVVGAVAEKSMAARAQLRSGDEIVAINGAPTRTMEAVAFKLIDGVSRDEAIQVKVRRASGELRELQLSPLDAAERTMLSDPANMMKVLGFGFYEPPDPAVINEVQPGGPAAVAGLLAGDRVVALNSAPIANFSEFSNRIAVLGGQSAQLQVDRSGTLRDFTVRVDTDRVAGKTVGRIRVSHRGAMMPADMMRHITLGPLAALQTATIRCWDLTVLQGRLLWRMVTGHVSVKSIGGPLSIAQMAGDSAIAGFSAFFSFLVIISLTLGFMNLLPIPILDGGQIVMQSIEWLKGSPLSERVQLAGMQVGIMLVVLLMGLALYNDVARQFGPG
jgi:regulator of sigma E protease